jgi:hypothetical protein
MVRWRPDLPRTTLDDDSDDSDDDVVCGSFSRGKGFFDFHQSAVATTAATTTPHTAPTIAGTRAALPDSCTDGCAEPRKSDMTRDGGLGHI